MRVRTARSTVRTLGTEVNFRRAEPSPHSHDEGVTRWWSKGRARPHGAIPPERRKDEDEDGEDGSPPPRNRGFGASCALEKT